MLCLQGRSPCHFLQSLSNTADQTILSGTAKRFYSTPSFQAGRTRASVAAVEAPRAASDGPSVQQLVLTRPDDWHLHLRDAPSLGSVAHHSASVFQRAIIMPNLRPPVTTTELALAYRQRILQSLPPDTTFEPLMTLYLTDNTSPEEVFRAKESGHVAALKLYPAGATTNSDAGVTDLFGPNCLAALKAMVEAGLPLLVHGEVTDPSVDMFDREAVFLERVLQPLMDRLPELRVVLEHVTTADAVKFVEEGPEGRIAATITPQHLLLNRNALFQGGLQPHNFCLPVLKRERHRRAVLGAATSGSPRFFLGTDSAPHERRTKEAPCGCAGVFSSPAAMPLYAHAFEQVRHPRPCPCVRTPLSR
eukprot:TRINITY_DN4497_c0_g1_i2.p1 TRINITY_DN4497_c0_g1~~TRINITY_DN4497_c0_g1_i2.p1  ORF type:complete len:362 (-),score=55.26 TRINITY_DN4497_c0_g1_i2:27-1112(-)